MILRQFLHDDPVVAAAYLVGCASRGVCAVVDPLYEIEPYLEAARISGMEIRFAIDTHVHADHRSGIRRVAEATGAEPVLGSESGARFPHLAVSEGESLHLGNVELRVLATPGHTPEHVSILLVDRTRAGDPWFVATGHTLLVGDMGRTELVSEPKAGAEQLFTSAEKLRGLPDEVAILPGAYSGSVCGRALSGVPLSTVGFERRFNPAFSLTDRAKFVEHMLRDVPPSPPEAATIRALNMGGAGGE